jgi:TRAP-type C4-dicarboxylate transport system substrate-binding protein
MLIMTNFRWLLPFTAIVLALAAAEPARAVDLKIATIAPDGTLWMKEMRRGAEEISKRTDGRVAFKFYPGGTMGSDRSVLRKIRAGQLHGGALTGGALADVYPEAQLYSLPLLFRSEAELDYVRARMDKTLAEGLEKHGFVTFGFTYGGFAYVMTNDPIRQVEQLKGQKVWVPEGDDISRALFETLGVSPVPLPITDVLTGLQTGLVTTVASSAVGAIALQWHTKVKYVTDIPALYLYGVLAVDRKTFNRLTPADQKIVREVMEPIFVRLDKQNRLDDRNARDALRKQGIEFVQLAPDEVTKLRKAADDTIERLGKKGAFSVAQLRTLQDHLDTYRRNAATGTRH